MSKKTTVWLMTAATLVLLGCILFAGILSTLSWDFTKLSTVKYETNTYDFSESFGDISIDISTADIVFAASDNERCKVECYETTAEQHFVAVEEDTLVIKLMDHKAWYDYIAVNFGTPRITVYLPKTEYGSLFIHEHTGDVKIPGEFTFRDANISLRTGDVDISASASGIMKLQTSTGDICAESISAGALDLTVSTGRVTVSDAACRDDVTLSVSTGKAYLTNVSCKNMISSGNTGDLTLDNVTAAETFSIERSTGDVKLNDCDAAEIVVKTGTGNVTGSLRSEKVFLTQTDTGKVAVPATTGGGRCQVTTSTGDILLQTTPQPSA